MKYLLAVLALSSMIGCASQPSTYEDNSTPDKRDIKATGQAATEAARSNSSRNGNIQTTTHTPIKVSHIDTYDMQNGRYVVYGPNGKRDHRAELRLLRDRQNSRNGRGHYGEYTSNQMSREFDHRMKRKIDKEVQRFMDKIF
jgi:hypothetical protein